MGRPIAVDGPSLDRLKALGSLPDVDVQYQEAQRLCTHSARADMILKWLLGTLKDSHNAIHRIQFWKTFDLTNINSCLELLLDLSDNIKGASLKAVMCLEAAAASRFVGVWMRQCFLQTTNPGVFFRIAVQIWNLRSHHPTENELFSKDCLLWVTAGLTKVSSHSIENVRKRKRDDCTLIARQSLESLVAKHIILPARSHFMTDQEQRSTKRSKAKQKPQMQLQQLLEPYKYVEAKLLLDEDFQMAWYAGAPFLLDLALRCVPVPTMKHRMNEKPWVEHVFISIANCAGLDHKGKRITVRACGALVDMLSVIGKRTTLSTEMLRKVIRGSVFDNKEIKEDVGGIAQDRDAGTALHQAGIDSVLHKVIELDASVFLDRVLLHDLFDHLRDTERHAQRHETPPDKSGTILQKTGPAVSSLGVQKAVLEPILRAFARERKLLDFLDIWDEQLRQCAGVDDLAAWTGIGGVFAELMETNFTEQQIIRVLDRFQNELYGKISAITIASDGPGLTATISILKSIFEGIRSEQLLDAVHDRAGKLLVSLARLLESKDKSIREHVDHSEIWRLCTLIFEIWHPKQAKEGRDPTALESSASEIFTSDVVHRAFQISYDACEGPALQRSGLAAAQQAIVFLACLCNHLGAAERNVSSVQTFARQIVRRTRKDLVVLPAILRYPSSILCLSEKQRSAFLGDLFCRFMEAKDTASVKRAIKAFCSLVSSLSTSQTRFLIDEIIAAVLRKMNPTSTTSSDQAFREVTAVSILEALTPYILSKVQSGIVIDVLLKLPDQVSEITEGNMQLRLSLVIKLLVDKSPAAGICTDSAIFWGVAENLNIMCQSQTEDENARVYELSSRLSYLVAKQLLENQAHEGCRTVLRDVISHMKQRISTIGARWLEHRPASSADASGTLAFSSGIFQAAGEHMSSDALSMVFQSEVLEHYIEAVSIAVKNTTTRKYEPGYNGSYSAALARALLSLQRTLRILKMEDQVNKSLAVLDLVARPLLALEGSAVSAGSNMDMTGMANEALHAITQKELPPVEFSGVVTKFKDLCATQCSGIDRINVIKHLLSRAEAETVRPALKLAKSALSSLEKSDYGEQDLPTRQTIMQTTLAITLRSSDVTSQQAALEFLMNILREKPFLTNQSNIESTVSCLQALGANKSVDGVIFHHLCSILTLLLQQYRSRISDRMHLVVGLLQALLTPFFRNARSKQTQTGDTEKQLGASHARALARCLQLICDPPTARPNSKTVAEASLVDSSRRAQAQIGRYISYVLHHYCTLILSGPPAPGVRDAMKPGVWSMIEAVDVNDETAVRALSAAMNVSERAVLRSLYEEWKTSGKWNGFVIATALSRRIDEHIVYSIGIVMIYRRNHGSQSCLLPQLADLPVSKVSKILTLSRSSPSGQLASSPSDNQGRLFHVTASIEDSAGVFQTAEDVKALLDGQALDVLANNAGAAAFSPGGISTCTEQQLNDLFDTNVVGVQRMVAAFLSLLEAGKEKKVVDIADSRNEARADPRIDRLYRLTKMGSISWSYDWAKTPSHAKKISKAALNMFTQQYASEYADASFTFLSISPGMSIHSLHVAGSIKVDDLVVAEDRSWWRDR
nr:hypothetical protein CFP56_44414 [Quercus suber]